MSDRGAHSLRGIRLAYGLNLLILTPIAIPALLHLFPVDQARFVESDGWRILVGALWTGILVLSALGLRNPLRFSPVLLLQVIYKSLWLLLYAGPRLLHGQTGELPAGIAVSFLCIVLVWPFLIPWGYLWEAPATSPLSARRV